MKLSGQINVLGSSWVFSCTGVRLETNILKTCYVSIIVVSLVLSLSGYILPPFSCMLLLRNTLTLFIVCTTFKTHDILWVYSAAVFA